MLFEILTENLRKILLLEGGLAKGKYSFLLLFGSRFSLDSFFRAWERRLPGRASLGDFVT